MAPAFGCSISMRLFALVKLHLETIISSLTAAMHVIKGKLLAVPGPEGNCGTHGVSLDLYQSGSDPLT